MYLTSLPVLLLGAAVHLGNCAQACSYMKNANEALKHISDLILTYGHLQKRVWPCPAGSQVGAVGCQGLQMSENTLAVKVGDVTLTTGGRRTGFRWSCSQDQPASKLGFLLVLSQSSMTQQCSAFPHHSVTVLHR